MSIASLFLGLLLLFHFPLGSRGSCDIYLGASTGVTAALGSNSNPSGGFVNVGQEQSLANIIDLDSPSDSELHTQTSHVWWSGVPLEIVLDLGGTYDLCQCHFWNYWTETFSVDEIQLEFVGESGEVVTSTTLFPPEGTNSGESVFANDFNLEGAVRVRTVKALLSATSSSIDFQNLGFTGSESIPMPGPSPGPSPSPTPGPSPVPSPPAPSHPAPSPFCFSGETTVQVLDKGSVEMKNLHVGDKILVVTNNNKAPPKTEFQTVYAFGHWDPDKTVEFLQLYYNGTMGPAFLEMTGGHLVYIRGKRNPVLADSVRVGDVLQAAYGGGAAVVTQISQVEKTGVYAPMTRDGTFVAEDIKVSSYVAIQHGNKEYVELQFGIPLVSHHFGIHLALTPLRILCSRVSYKYCEIHQDDGMPLYVSRGIHAFEWLDSLGLNLVIQIPLAIVIILAFGLLYGIETMATLALGSVTFAFSKK